MNIAVLDVENLGNDLNFSCLESIGKYTLYNHTSDTDFFKHCANKDIIICNRTKFCKERLAQLPLLKLIAITATGVNTVDVEYAKAHNIAVTNVPAYSTQSVTQHTFATLFSLLEHLPYYDEFVKNKNYSNSRASTHLTKVWYDLSTLRWGIIGLGAIGKNVANIAKMFGAEIVYYSTSGKNTHSDFERVELDQLLGTCDVISIHAPLNKNTKNLLNKNKLQLLKPNVILINMGRGGIVDEAVLAEMIDRNAIAGVAIDVFENEPLAESSMLLKVKNLHKVLLTPHMAWASVQSRTQLINEVYKNIQAFVNGKTRNRIV